MQLGNLRGQSSVPRWNGQRGAWPGARYALLTVVIALVAMGCGKSKAALPPTTIATTTTSTTVPVVSNLTVVGVRPGVLQAPFYPQTGVTKVTCGKVPAGNGRFVRVDLPAGAAGTTARSVLTMATAVIVVPGAAVLVDPRYITRVLYVEAMKSVTTASQGALVLTMHNLAATGGDGLAVVVGNVQLNGDYECPDTDVVYPGT